MTTAGPLPHRPTRSCPPDTATSKAWYTTVALLPGLPGERDRYRLARRRAPSPSRSGQVSPNVPHTPPGLTSPPGQSRLKRDQRGARLSYLPATGPFSQLYCPAQCHSGPVPRASVLSQRIRASRVTADRPRQRARASPAPVAPLGSLESGSTVSFGRLGGMLTDPVTVERDGRVLLIGVNRPAKRNAFDLAVIEALGEAYETLGTDGELRAGVLFGHGDHFSAGLDLAQVGPEVARHGPGVLVGPHRFDPFAVWADPVPKPVVLAVSGIA